jgi:hypothetical protein
VVVTAQYKSDGIERVILVDPDCEEVGITPRTPKHYTGEADLAKALSVGRPGTLDKIIKGTFVGKFRWSPQENQKFILVLGQVRDLSSMMK